MKKENPFSEIPEDVRQEIDSKLANEPEFLDTVKKGEYGKYTNDSLIVQYLLHLVDVYKQTYDWAFN